MLDGSARGALPLPRRPTKSSTLDAFAFDEEEETANAGAVRSIHELRQAGANNRLADEMDDILDRIGSPSNEPSSMRRGALLELAMKVKEKEFRGQFRDHGNGGGPFKSLKHEADSISGFALASILAILLSTSGSAHFIQDLRSQGLAPFLSRLLEDDKDIDLMAKDRKHNVSKNARATLSAIKSTIISLPTWAPVSPSHLSPRTLALECLYVILKQLPEAAGDTELFTSPVTDQLFSILSTEASTGVAPDGSSEHASVDLYLSLSVLEQHSIHAMQSRRAPRWTSKYVPVIGETLASCLGGPVGQFDELESLVLRITLNVTNHNSEACWMLVNAKLSQQLVEAACAAFDAVLDSMAAGGFLAKVHEALLLMLGVMINFCVYYPPAAQNMEECGDGPRSPLTRLIRLFADNHSKTSDADSIEKTRLNVALGYLSILLGYLCLSDGIKSTFVSMHPKKSIQPLRESINEFITFHQKVAKAREGDGTSKQESELTRLHSLVEELEKQ